MRFESVPMETMMDELGQIQRENPSWGISLASAPAIQATLLGQEVAPRSVMPPLGHAPATTPTPRRARTFG